MSRYRVKVAAKLYDDRIELLKTALRRQAVDLRRLELELIAAEAEKHALLTKQRPWAVRRRAA